MIQVVLVSLVFIGLDRGDLDIVVNALISLGVTYLPAILERDYRIPVDAGLTLWISPAVFLHALGTVGFPDSETNFHAGIQWWDRLTRALLSSVVAAAGYATIRAVDEYTVDTYLPPWFMFVFILLLIPALDIFWEAIELAISGVTSLADTVSALTQYDLGDTLLDLVFSAVGDVIVVVWGTVYLSDMVGVLQQRLETAPR